MSGVPGMVKRKAVPTTMRSRMWQSMRVMRRFSVRDLIAVAEASDSHVRRYVRELRRAGYVRPVHITNFTALNDTIYLLIRNTGPQAPRIRRHSNVVWDPNTRDKILRTKDERCGGTTGAPKRAPVRYDGSRGGSGRRSKVVKHV